MTWYASSTNRTTAENAHVEVVTFIELDFPSGWVYFHTGTGSITWGGATFLGVGKLGIVSEVVEDAQLRPSGVTLTLSGVDSALVTAAMTEKYHGRAVAIFQGFLNTSTLALVADPQTVFTGLMDYMTVELGQNTGSITVNCESELARWNKHNGSLYTHESQQAIYAGDRGFDLIPFIQNRKIDWSKTNTGFNSMMSGLATRTK